MELVELSQNAGRTMATALGNGLRLTAILDQPPGGPGRRPRYVTLPQTPAAWFAPTGERIA